MKYFFAITYQCVTDSFYSFNNFRSTSLSDSEIFYTIIAKSKFNELTFYDILRLNLLPSPQDLHHKLVKVSSPILTIENRDTEIDYLYL